MLHGCRKPRTDHRGLNSDVDNTPGDLAILRGLNLELKYNPPGANTMAICTTTSGDHGNTGGNTRCSLRVRVCVVLSFLGEGALVRWPVLARTGSEIGTDRREVRQKVEVLGLVKGFAKPEELWLTN